MFIRENFENIAKSKEESNINHDLPTINKLDNLLV